VTAVEPHKRARLRRPRIQDLIALAIPALVGALLCAIELGTRSLWLDEGSTFAITSQHGAALWKGIKGDGGNMLLYYLLIHVVIKLFGGAAWVLRLPSLLATAATGGLTTLLGLRLFGDRRKAVAGGLLTVVSLPLVFWGQNARGYALMVALAAASMLAFVTLLERPSRGAIVGYVLSTLAMLYVGYDAALLVLAQLALLVQFRERIRLLVGCLVAVGVGCVPLLILAAQRGSGQLFWVPPLSFGELGQTGETLLSTALPPNFHHTVTTIAATVLSAVAVLAALAAAATVVRRHARRQTHWQVSFLLAWVLIPAVIGVLASVAGEPIELARCAILLMPGLALLVVWALCDPRLPRFAGALGVTVLLGLRLAQVIPAYGVSPENWKAATAYTLAVTGQGRACVAFYPQDGRESFDYYLRGDAAADRLTPVLPTLGWATVKPYVEHYGTLSAAGWKTVAASCPRLFLIASHQGQRGGTPASRVDYARYQTILTELSSHYAGHSQRKFGWASPVRVTVFTRWAAYH